MAKLTSSLLVYILVTLIFYGALLITNAADEDRQAYVVYMGSLPRLHQYSPEAHHIDILQEVVGDISASSFLLRSYKRSFNGFAAKLTDSEIRKLASMKDVVSIFPSRTLQLTTTRSWDFVGLSQRARRNRRGESDVIIGVIDTGIWPESESFSDEGFGPPPDTWKGACRGGKNFTCNNKLIGARFYGSRDTEAWSARDDHGHGTHTASTAAGNAVQGASFYGLAQGTARGAVPWARVATYKVCHKNSGCNDADIMAAFDDAISDGVDVISISISSSYVSDLMNDSIAIGSFHAMLKGIVTAASAGNGGPVQGTVSNISPWIITTAASVMDRQFSDKVILGNGKALKGLSINPFNLNGTNFPIVYGRNVSTTCSEFQSGGCDPGCVDSKMVKGKIVLCDLFEGNREADIAGASGAIVQNTLQEDVAFVLPLPASSLTYQDCDFIKSYIKSTAHPHAEILRSEEIKDREAPYVPSFSSRGPSFLIRDLMKPDVAAPGLEILAAYSPVASPSSSPIDPRSVRFNILSGTSMACPHVAGVAAFVRSFHPSWSPSSVKSAIMTTAMPINPQKNPDREFAFGSGNVNPTKAIDPGLIYEIRSEDYAEALCAEGYDSAFISKISGQSMVCPTGPNRIEFKDLNYPAMAAFFTAMDPFEITFRRTVTNVGFANSTYKARIIPPQREMKITVEPRVLSYRFTEEKKTFAVTISGKDLKDGTIVSSSIVWSDGSHSVRSPIVAYSIMS